MKVRSFLHLFGQQLGSDSGLLTIVKFTRFAELFVSKLDRAIDSGLVQLRFGDLDFGLRGLLVFFVGVYSIMRLARKVFST